MVGQRRPALLDRQRFPKGRLPRPKVETTFRPDRALKIQVCVRGSDEGDCEKLFMMGLARWMFSGGWGFFCNWFDARSIWRGNGNRLSGPQRFRPGLLAAIEPRREPTNTLSRSGTGGLLEVESENWTGFILMASDAVMLEVWGRAQFLNIGEGAEETEWHGETMALAPL